MRYKVCEIELRPHINIRRPSSLADFVVTDRYQWTKFGLQEWNYIGVLRDSEIKRRFENNSDMLVAISIAEEFDTKLLKPLKSCWPSDAKHFIARERHQYEKEMSGK